MCYVLALAGIGTEAFYLDNNSDVVEHPLDIQLSECEYHLQSTILHSSNENG